MKLSLDDISIFLTIADEGGFSAAARRLGLPKSTVSRRLSELEDALGESLFNRTTRALSLTNAGQRHYDLTKSAIAGAEDVARQMRDTSSEVSGLVRITATAAIAEHILAPKIDAFLRAHPHCQVAIRTSERRIDIVAEGIDLAVRMGPLRDSDLVARRLLSVRRIIVASPAYIQKTGAPTAPPDLSQHACIVTSPETATWRFADGWEVDAPWRMAAGNMAIARRMCLAGQGLALLPDFLVREDLNARTLQQVLSAHPTEAATASLVTPRHRYRSPAVRLLMEALTTPSRGSNN